MYRFYGLIILLFIFACEKSQKVDLNITIDKTKDFRKIYQFDDFFLNYIIEGNDYGEYDLSLKLFCDSTSVNYYCHVDTINFKGYYCDSVNIRSLEYNDYPNLIEFDKIPSQNYKIQFCLNKFNSEISYKSNLLILDINSTNPDSNTFGNYTFTDLNGSEYELVDILETNDYLLLFSFAFWCGWSQKSIPQMNYIDSVYNNLKVIGIEVSQNHDKEMIRKQIKLFNVIFPIVIREDNTNLHDIIASDNIISIPSFILLNKNRKIQFQNTGYLDNMTDTINYMIN